MLKAHQACIDLERNVLRIRGREVKFLDEHELPEKVEVGQDQESGSQPSGSGSSNLLPAPEGQNYDSPFPGQGGILGASKDTSQEVPPTTTPATNPVAGNLGVLGIENQTAAGPGRDDGGSGTILRRLRPSTDVAIALSLVCALLAFIFSTSLFDF